MENSTIAIIILLVTIVLFFIEKIPTAATAILSMLAMGFFGVITWPEAFEGMSNSVVLFCIGVAVLGGAFFTTGLANKIGKAIFSLGKKGISEKALIALLFMIGVATSAFFNGCMVVAILFPIIDAVSVYSKGKILRKNVYYSTAVSTVFGSNVSIIGSTSMMLAVGILAGSAEGLQAPFFEPIKIGLPACILAIVYYLTFGHRFQKKCFNFPEIPPPVNDMMSLDDTNGEQAPKLSKKDEFKCWFVAFITVLTIVLVALGLNYGAVAMLSAVILIVTQCIDIKTAFSSVSWNMIFTVVGSFGLAKGLKVSGASELIVDGICELCGPLASSPLAMCIVMLFVATLISNFMSNGAAVAITAPIAITIAQSLGVSGLPFVMAVGVGANISISTPMAVSQVTMSMVVGYRAKDLIKVGGLLNLLAFIVTAIAIWLFYYAR